MHQTLIRHVSNFIRKRPKISGYSLYRQIFNILHVTDSVAHVVEIAGLCHGVRLTLSHKPGHSSIFTGLGVPDYKRAARLNPFQSLPSQKIDP